jgi:hypothetical protein
MKKNRASTESAVFLLGGCKSSHLASLSLAFFRSH